MSHLEGRAASAALDDCLDRTTRASPALQPAPVRQMQQRRNDRRDQLGEFHLAMFNGLVLGALLALISSGLTIIYGTLGVLNLAHGAMFMLGGYAGWVAYDYTGSFIVAVIAGSLFVMLVGVVMERVIIRHFYARPHEDQLLVTFGLGIVFVETVRLFFGSLSQDPSPAPAAVRRHHAARLHVLSDLPARAAWHRRRGAARALRRALSHPHRHDRARRHRRIR